MSRINVKLTSENKSLDSKNQVFCDKKNIPVVELVKQGRANKLETVLCKIKS